jgi:UDP-3-O-[3-hydroxymyristoyl] glucosamine N-acyltransferase
MGRALIEPISAGRLAGELDLDLQGDPSALICRVDAVDTAAAGSLCFAKNTEWVSKAPTSAVLLATLDCAHQRVGSTLLSRNPRLDFARAIGRVEILAGFRWADAEPEIHPSARIGRNVVLGRGVKIGAGTTIYHNVVIGDEVVIGQRCVIKSGAVIGEEGFGFERDSNGRAVRLPHIGSVRIEDDVEVGSLTTVCRGTLGDTVLRHGCKIDDHVHVAHNVDVGEDAFVIACAEVSGGVRIGQRAWIAPNASVLNQLTIGVDAIVGLGAVVVKSVPDRVVVVGNPAKPLSR